MTDNNFNIVVGEFSGSLEALLEMVKRRKMHISEVSLAKVADDYIGYVKGLDEVDNSDIANFIVIAATLLLIKSKSLLPSLVIAMEEEENIKDLESKLELYSIYKYANNVLAEHIKSNKSYYAPRPSIGINNSSEAKTFIPTVRLNLTVLGDVMQGVLKQLPKVDNKLKVEIEEKINIKEVMHSLLSRVEAGVQNNFTNLSGSNNQEVLTNFLALLELIKDGVLLAQQDDTYGDIMIDR